MGQAYLEEGIIPNICHPNIVVLIQLGKRNVYTKGYFISDRHRMIDTFKKRKHLFFILNSDHGNCEI